ncbi:alpha/beta hydrolase [Nitriliruptoraceae bacterium ZYF776]|nr:alpha/beta hydrolase [Profundirhabdus halotolerans]
MTDPDVHLPGRTPRHRGPLRRLLEVRGVLGGHRRPHALVGLTAADGTRLAGSYLAGPPTAPTAVLLLHGFLAHRRKPAYAALADTLADRFPVLALDLRGHGGSAGSCTLGDHEAEDVAAGVAWLRDHGRTHVAIVGASMGATSALHAVASGTPADALVTISAPAWFREEGESAALAQLRRIWERPVTRAGVRAVLGVRVAGPAGWRSPPHPAEMAQAVRIPWLVVHGDDDHYFPPSDADALHAAARGPVVRWHEPAGFGHAEDGFTPSFAHRLRDAIGAVARDGRFPAP